LAWRGANEACGGMAECRLGGASPSGGAAAGREALGGAAGQAAVAAGAPGGGRHCAGAGAENCARRAGGAAAACGAAVGCGGALGLFIVSLTCCLLYTERPRALP
jgi:hypothetical protein